MLKFIARRFVNYLVLVFIATSLAYILGALTLDPRARYEGRVPPIPPAVIHATLQERNADPATPVLVRYGHWLKGVVHGDFGKQIVGEDTVASEMKRRIGVSLRLLLLGTIFGAVGGVLVGVLGAVRQRKPVDVASTFASYVLLASPTVVIIIVVQLIFVWIGHHGGPLLPTANEYDSTLHGFAFWTDRAKRLIMPTLTLALFGISFFSRYQRSAMLDVLGSDFLRTARAKGLTRQQALFKHGVRTALIPIVTFFAYSFGLLLTGAIFTETLFNWHGMGQYLIQSVQSHDVNAVAAVSCFTAVLVLLSGLLSDVLYAALDPRVRSK
ncbi:MAG: ABC transporter permease [Jatrophihabitantaceae bacterium]